MNGRSYSGFQVRVGDEIGTAAVLGTGTGGTSGDLKTESNAAVEDAAF
jgi:hypothetical protein